MRLLKTCIVSVSALAVSSCQPPMYDLNPFMNAGLLHFDVDFPGFWPFKWKKSDAEASYLEVVTSDEILWAIEASKAAECTKATENPSYRESASISFPLKFGVTPRCFVNVTAPKKIPDGRVVLVRSIGGVTEGSGLFKLEEEKVTKVREAGAIWDKAPTHNSWWGNATNQSPSEKAVDNSDGRAWNAGSHTALAITGDILVSPARFQAAGISIPIKLVADVSEFAAYDGPVRARIFAPITPSNPRLLNGNTLGCSKPIRWIAIWEFNEGNELAVEIFDGTEIPRSEKTNGFCASYFYLRK